MADITPEVSLTGRVTPEVSIGGKVTVPETVYLQGLQGEKGDPGPKGDTGSQGERGEKGDAFTYADFTEEQLAALKGPKGDTGAKGDKGDQGPQGEQGNPGEPGAPGADGHTPVITAEKSGKVTTIKVDGVVVATVSDGVVATVNSKTPDASGNVALTGGDIPMSADDSTTLSAAIGTKLSSADGAVGTNNLGDGVVTAEKIAPAAVTGEKLAALAVLATHIAQGAVTAQKLAADAVKLTFSSTSVPAASFVSDSTYADYPYRAAVALTGVSSSMIPEVVFGVSDAMSGNFAPVAEAYDGGIHLYAAAVPDAAITIPTILAWR